MSGTDERNEREAGTEDVDAHLLDAPPTERPPAERTDEGDDVEAHNLTEAPPTE
ncbi:MAG: hypothetical protein ACRDKU_02705 [Gaiellaceae bacterium]